MSRVLFLASDLSSNPVYTPWQFAGALEGAGHRTLLAGVREGAALWAPLVEALDEAVRLPSPLGGLPGAEEACALGRDADVVYAFKAMPTSLGVGLRVREETGRPLLLHLDDWEAGWFADEPLPRRLWHALRSWRSPRGTRRLRAMEARIPEADALTVSSRALQERFGGTLVRQGVDTDRWDPARFPRDEARKRLGVDPEAPMVLFLGTPRPHKGLGGLERVAERAQLWLVGGDEAGLREAGVGEALRERARVRGPVPFSEAAWYLAACDVFVVPQAATRYAAFQLPAKLLQAMALGAPVVATDVGDARELLEGEGEGEAAGVVVPAGDPEALAAAVLELAADRARGRALGAEARRRAVADLSWRAMARRVEAVMARVGVRG